MYRIPLDRDCGALLRTWRTLRGVSQTRAAALYGVSLRAWQYYEAGTRRPPGAVLTRVVHALNRSAPRDTTP